MEHLFDEQNPLKMHRIACKTAESYATVGRVLDDYPKGFLLDDTVLRDGTFSLLLSCTSDYALSLGACSKEVTVVCIEDLMMPFMRLS